MKLQFDVQGKCQPDPFIFEDEGKYYLFVTGWCDAEAGVEVYSADEPLTSEWHYEGIATQFGDDAKSFWAPSVIKYENRYYMYVSCEKKSLGIDQHMHVAVSNSPLGPYKDEVMLYDHFSIDSHMVQTDAGLFLFFAEDRTEGEKIGTRVFVDRFLDPYTPAREPKEVVSPDFDEELFMRNRYGDGRDWYTIEGPFYFCEDGYHYLMYSGGCFQDDTYHIGYSYAKSDETDLTKVDFVKKTENGGVRPIIIGNGFEEGAGHHSVLKYKGEYYAFYHARDIGTGSQKGEPYVEARTARVCRMTVRDGEITAEQKENSL